MIISDRKKRLIEKLKNKEYRDSFVLSNIYNNIAFQIKTIREKNNWTQKELGVRSSNMKQERISVLENPNNTSVTISTLQRIASAFDVALMIKFIPFSELIKHNTDLSEESLFVENFGNEFIKEKPREIVNLHSSILKELTPKVINIDAHKTREKVKSALSFYEENVDDRSSKKLHNVMVGL